jgi:hypothetical protein
MSLMQAQRLAWKDFNHSMIMNKFIDIIAFKLC